MVQVKGWFEPDGEMPWENILWDRIAVSNNYETSCHSVSCRLVSNRIGCSSGKHGQTNHLTGTKYVNTLTTRHSVKGRLQRIVQESSRGEVWRGLYASDLQMMMRTIYSAPPRPSSPFCPSSPRTSRRWPAPASVAATDRRTPGALHHHSWHIRTNPETAMMIFSAHLIHHKNVTH